MLVTGNTPTERSHFPLWTLGLKCSAVPPCFCGHPVWNTAHKPRDNSVAHVTVVARVTTFPPVSNMATRRPHRQQPGPSCASSLLFSARPPEKPGGSRAVPVQSAPAQSSPAPPRGRTRADRKFPGRASGRGHYCRAPEVAIGRASAAPAVSELSSGRRRHGAWGGRAVRSGPVGHLAARGQRSGLSACAFRLPLPQNASTACCATRRTAWAFLGPRRRWCCRQRAVGGSLGWG